MKPIHAGIIAATIMSFVVAATLFLAGGSAHLLSELERSGLLYAVIVLSFGAQITMFAAHRAHRAAVASSAGSGAAMIACCMHHAADLAPLAGLLPFLLPLAQYQQPILFGGALLSIAATAWMAGTYASRLGPVGFAARNRFAIAGLITITLTLTTYGGML